MANISEDSVTISWLPPERDGGSRIIRYVLEKCDPSASQGWVPVHEVDSSAVLITCVEGLYLIQFHDFASKFSTLASNFLL